jgi:hypothetical protein
MPSIISNFVLEDNGKSNFVKVGTEYAYGQMCICTQGTLIEIQNQTHWTLNGPAACAIIQQYSSTTFILFPYNHFDKSSVSG